MKRITLERLARKWTQSRLAREAEMHPSTVCAIEAGRLIPWPGQRDRLAAALAWPAERAGELFEDVEPRA